MWPLWASEGSGQTDAEALGAIVDKFIVYGPAVDGGECRNHILLLPMPRQVAVGPFDIRFGVAFRGEHVMRGEPATHGF